MAEKKCSDVLSLIERARVFATERHFGAFCEHKAHEPFIAHPTEVAVLVERSGGSKAEIAAAWLHDTVEDTPTTLDEIEKLFGPEVRKIVDGLTDPPDFRGLPLLIRKARQAKRTQQSESVSVKRVKIADQIANVRSLSDPPIEWNRQKCRDYVEGARFVAMACQRVSDYLDSEFKRVYTGIKQSWEAP